MRGIENSPNGWKLFHDGPERQTYLFQCRNNRRSEFSESFNNSVIARVPDRFKIS